MKELLFLVIAGIAGVVTFAVIARKYGSDCLP